MGQQQFPDMPGHRDVAVARAAKHGLRESSEEDVASARVRNQLDRRSFTPTTGLEPWKSPTQTHGQLHSWTQQLRLLPRLQA